MKVYIPVLLIVLFFNSFKVNSLNIILCPEVKKKEAKLNIYQNPKITGLIERQIEFNKENPGIMGYRIQVDLGHSRLEAMELQSKLNVRFPDIPTYIIYEQPYFKLRLGDFRTRLDVQHFFYRLSDEFHNIFIVPDRISLPELKN